MKKVICLLLCMSFIPALFSCGTTPEVTTAEKTETDEITADTVYDKNNDDGWRLLTVDLSEELTWKDRINGFRLDISPDDSLNGESADIMWIGFFRNAKDAFVYAGMGDYYKSQYESETVTETETESIPDETESDTSPSPETTGSVSETAENISVVNPNEGNEKVPIGKIIGIVIACAAATAVVVCVIIIALKKRKKQ